jgi:hypothetical protein
MARTCLFCGRIISDRAKEHVIPAWLQKTLGIADNFLLQVVSLTATNEVIDRRLPTFDQHREGRICAACNNGWMSDLETDAGLVLKPLLAGHADIRHMSLPQRVTVARWAAKTAFMVNSSSSYDVRVPDIHFTGLYQHRHRLPLGVCVIGQIHSPSCQIHVFQGPAWMVSGNVPTRDELVKAFKSSYKIGLQIGNLMLVIGYFPIAAYTLDLWRDVHCCLWPLIPRVVWRDQGLDFPWLDSVEALGTFLGSVWVRL